ncbi:MAG: zf-HC2 domain-containing protein [Tepidisphaeraceae bacterium]
MPCDKAAQIHAYHDGELSPAARSAAQAHLRQCAECRALLADLRRLSGLLTESPLPEMPAGAAGRLLVAWAHSRDRDVRRLAGWLTAAAAFVLGGSLLIRPPDLNKPAARPIAVDSVAEMLPIEPRGDAGIETMQLAQWIAEDLSRGTLRESP